MRHEGWAVLMAEGKQINIWAPAELVARLEEIQPSGVALAVVARKLIRKVLGAAADLPRLSGAGENNRPGRFQQGLNRYR